MYIFLRGTKIYLHIHLSQLRCIVIDLFYKKDSTTRRTTGAEMFDGYVDFALYFSSEGTL